MTPAPALAQRAGGDQYREPFPEAKAQNAQADDTPTETTGDGLSQTPPTSGTDDSKSSGTSTEKPEPEDKATDADKAEPAASELARTGDDPWLIALAGGSLLLLGAGMRLRGGAQRRY